MVGIRRSFCFFLSSLILVSAAFCSTALHIKTSAYQSFKEQMDSFPESYRPYLTALHNEHPNWTFYADNINMSFDDAVSLELTRKVIGQKNSRSWFSMGLGAYDYQTDNWVPQDTDYYLASRELIMYYMDPRNFLNSNDIYTFMLQGYDPSTQNTKGLISMVGGSFLNTEEYIDILMEAGRVANVNPYVLAAKIKQEQGSGSSRLISGNYPGYEGYYNYFNVQAYGNSKDEKYRNGLNYAKAQGWNSRRASIIGGAKFYAKKYISVGQNTFYYMDYNVENPDKIFHQYAAAVYDAVNKAENLKSIYSSDKLMSLSFRIPVYRNMGDIAALPEKSDKLNNYYFSGIEVEGLTGSFNRFNYSYNLEISSDTTIKVKVPSGASYISAGSFDLSAGISEIVLTVKGQTGYKNDYKICVKSNANCRINIDVVNNADGVPSRVMRGDTNGDGIISGRDAANIQLHILDIRKLTSTAFEAADTNNDGVVNGRDAANLQLHILGIKSLT